ncbi:MAG: polysaccharide deacetylase family protein [Chitinophagales bacterium]
MSLVKSIARKIVFPAVVTLNLEKLFSFFAHHNKLILVYHGVVENPDHEVSLGPIGLKQFEQHLQYFQQNFDVVCQDEIFRMYRTGFVPKRKTIALTFDDGYENNYTRVFPLLRKYNFPATMYIISQAIENEDLITWYDIIDFVKTDLNPGKIDVSMFNRPPLSSIDDLKVFAKSLNIENRNRLYVEIRKQVKIEDYIPQFPREYWKLMNRQQLKELSDSGLVEIAAHSHHHPNLGLISLADAGKEITQSKKTLEDLIQKEVYSLAFPDGSYTEDVKKICLEAGYRNLLAVDPQCDSDKNDLSILPRCCISSTTTFESCMIHVNREFNRLGF